VRRTARPVGQISAALTAAAVLLGSGPLLAQSTLVLPKPSYDNTVYVFFDAPGLSGDDATFQATADAINARVTGGPYGRVGMGDFYPVEMDWNVDLGNPVLQFPSAAALSAILARAQARGFAVHLGTIAGVSRDRWIYDSAKIEDRRNCQWYLDGLIKTDEQDFSYSVWPSLSRYARKFRRHLETKVRLYARLLIALRQAYPDTLISASGDGESELGNARLDDAVPYDQQIIADYSPFAILEFRDWIQHTGLYAPGQPYDGQGYPQGGEIYQGDAGLARFKLDFGTCLRTWDLQYFNWTLSDPVDADPRAIPRSVYDGPVWTPLPTSGPDYIACGFDAPRLPDSPGRAFWNLWQRFRRAMVSNYVRDFASWITTTAGPGGNRFPPERWYSHQIPADYIEGTNPSGPNAPRLATSASPMSTGVVGNLGSLGLTCFDLFVGTYYQRCSQYLFDDVAALRLPNWGLPEYNPAFPSIGLVDSDVASITAQILRAYEAGAHILIFNPWEHFATTYNPEAFSSFLAQVKAQPRDSGAVEYLPPQVQGVSWSWFSSTISLSWQSQVFSDVPNLAWVDWPAFHHFEIWRGAASGFTTADGELVRSTSATVATGIAPDPVKTFYRVLAVNRSGHRGELSTAVSPLSPGGAAFYTLTPCRMVDTRDPPGPLAGPSLASVASRVFALTGACGIPASARAVSVNVTVVRPAAAGHLTFYPGDASPALTSTINFQAGLVRANNAILPLSAAGGLGVSNGAAGAVDVLIDVNGYFR